MATKWKDVKHKNITPERIAHLDGKLKQVLLQMELRDLRLEAGQTQEELAEAVDMTQPELSRFERREDQIKRSALPFSWAYIKLSTERQSSQRRASSVVRNVQGNDHC
jgi:predicted transcriptional regulator